MTRKRSLVRVQYRPHSLKEKRTINNINLRVNAEIRCKEVRVINGEGQQLGIMSVKDALAAAVKEELDLVEVNPNSEPPVCRILGFGLYKYQQTTKEHDAKKKQHVVKVKEIKIRPQIEEHDYQVKLGSALNFLEKGNKVKMTLVFKGRELAHKEIGEGVLKKFCNEVIESKLGVMESEGKMIGRSITLVLAPTRLH